MVDFTSNRHVSFPRGWYLYPTKNNGLLEIFHPKNGLPSKPFQPDENFSGSNLKRLGAKPLPELRQKEAPLLNFFGPQKGNKNASFLRPKMHHNYRTFFVGKKRVLCDVSKKKKGCSYQWIGGGPLFFFFWVRSPNCRWAPPFLNLTWPHWIQHRTFFLGRDFFFTTWGLEHVTQSRESFHGGVWLTLPETHKNSSPALRRIFSGFLFGGPFRPRAFSGGGKLLGIRARKDTNWHFPMIFTGSKLTRCRWLPFVVCDAIVHRWSCARRIVAHRLCTRWGFLQADSHFFIHFWSFLSWSPHFGGNHDHPLSSQLYLQV